MIARKDHRTTQNYKAEGDEITARKIRNWSGNLIKARDNFLNALLSVNSKEVLNDNPGSGYVDRGFISSAELKQYLDRVKITAIEDGGNVVNYESIRTSEGHTTYKNECSPKLYYFDPSNLKDRSSKITFWVNLYNALVIDAVITYGIQKSVIEGRFGVLGFFRKSAYLIDGQRVSCEDIEHGILRANRGHPYLPGPQFASNDPRMDWVIDEPDVRIHFALNCASRSCPPIQVYDELNLDRQLDIASRNFVDSNVRIDHERDILYTSEIFRWFKNDFGGKDKVIRYLIDYLPEGNRRVWLSKRSRHIRIKYDPYDWGLNSP
jgi:hypothetical protein